MNDRGNIQSRPENQGESDSPTHDFREIPGAPLRFGIFAVRECVIHGERQEYVYDGVFYGWFDERKPIRLKSNPESRESQSPQESMKDFVEDFFKVFPTLADHEIDRISQLDREGYKGVAYLVSTKSTKTKFPNRPINRNRVVILNDTSKPTLKVLYDQLAHIESVAPEMIEDTPEPKGKISQIIGKLASK